MIFEALSKELGSIVIIIDAVDEFKSSDLAFLPENLPKGITVLISARKFARDYKNGKRIISSIKHNGFSDKDEKAIMGYYGLSSKDKGANQFMKNVLKKTNGWPLIVCDIKKQLKEVNNDFTKVRIETSLNSVFYRKKDMWKEDGTTDCCRWKLLELFSVFASASYLSKDNIQSYLMTDSRYSNMHSEDIAGILDCVSDQLVSNDGGLNKLKYSSFAEYITDNKTGFTTIELRRIINDIVCWISESIDDNIELAVPFYLAWHDNFDEKIKNTIEKIIGFLMDKNKYDRLTGIAVSLMSKNKQDSTIERCLEFALKQDENAKLLYALYLYNIVKTDDSKKKAISFYMELAEKENEQAIYIYAKMLCTGTDHVEIDEKKALELLGRVEKRGSNTIIGTIYNIVSKKNSEFYDNDRAISILYTLVDKNDTSGMAILGWRLFEGDGVEQDEVEGEKWLRKAAEEGNLDAMRVLGMRLLDGNGVKPNREEGERWLRKAAEAGNLEAIRLLGMRLIEGIGVKPNREEGEKWLRKAAEEGNLETMRVLGMRLLDGNGVKPNREEGEKWLRKAAEEEEPQAMRVLGLRLIKGNGVKPNRVEGEKWLRKAAETGNLDAMGLLGERLLDGNGIEQNREEGKKWLRKAAEAGNLEAMRVFGLRLFEGDGVEQNSEEGEKWLRKTAEAGNLDAMGLLGERLLDGNGIDQSRDEGEKWLRKTAEAGNLEAMRVFGLRLLEGDGVEQNREEGEKWLRKAAEAGNLEAMGLLSVRLLDGNGIEQNREQGEKWLRKTAEAGNLEAMGLLSVRLLDGNGIEQNRKEGEKWLRKAAEAGNLEAMRVFGLRLLGGDGVDQNREEGEKWLRKTAEAGNLEAMGLLSVRLLDGNGIEQNRKEGEKWLRKTAEAGNLEAMRVFGLRLLEGDGVEQNREEGEKWLRKAAETGNLDAMGLLGERLLDGNGIEQSREEGEKWLRKAAEAGNLEAMRVFGLRLLEGDGVEQNREEGEKWLRKAAEAGNLGAMGLLGQRLIEGDGVKQNIAEGMRFCKTAIDKGDAEVANNLGFYFYKIRDYSKSVDFIETGLLLGSHLAKINLSYIIRKAKYPNYNGTPTLEELLSDLANKDKNTLALVNYALYLISNLCEIDWVKADGYITLIDCNSTGEISVAINWWQSISDEGDLEGDLVLGWLCLKGKAKNPKGMTAKERFLKAKEEYNIPDWLMEMANEL